MKGCKFVLFMLFCVLPALQAQKHMLDSVFLNNGSIIVGKVVNYKPSAYVRIQTGGDVYFFAASNITKLCIHSFDVNDGVFREIVMPEKKMLVDSTVRKASDAHGYTAEYVREKYAQPLRHDDGFPVDMFFVQASLEIESIYSLAKVYGQSKYQIIYSRRFVPTSAFGFGACLRHLDFESFAGVIFADVRTIKINGADFSSFSFNPGIVFYDGTLGYNANIAFSYAIRIRGNAFITLGVDVNYQSNRFRRYSTRNNWSYYVSGYDGAINPGVVVGLLF